MISFLIELLWRWLVDDVNLFTRIGIIIYCWVTRQNKPSETGRLKRTELSWKVYHFYKKIGFTYDSPTER